MQIFFSEDSRKFRNLQISKILNTDPKSTLKYQVYCQVFWVALRCLQNRCIFTWMLVFYFCISNKLFFQKDKIFHIKKLNWKNVVVWLFLIFRFSFSFFNVFLLSLSMSSNFYMACIFEIFFFRFKRAFCSTWKKN